MEKSISLKLYSTPFIFLLLLPHFEPTYFNYIKSLDIIYNILRVISSLVIIILYSNNTLSSKRIDVNRAKILLILFIYYGELIFSTIINNVDIKLILLRAVSQFSIFMICIYYASWVPDNLICAIFYLGELLTYINLLTLLLFPNGLYSSTINPINWFLGYKNQFFPFYIGFFVVAFLYGKAYRKKIRSILLITCMIFSLFLANSTTSIIATILFIVLALIIKVDKGKRINSLSLSIINIVTFAFVVIFRQVNKLSFIIVDILGRNTTLTGRIRLWDEILIMIRKKIMIGYGFRSNPETAIMFKRYWAVHAHNMILQSLFEGGVIGLILFLILNYLLLKRLYEYRYSYSAQVISAAIFVLMVAQITEVYNIAALFVVYALACSVEYIHVWDKHVDFLLLNPIIIENQTSI